MFSGRASSGGVGDVARGRPGQEALYHRANAHAHFQHTQRSAQRFGRRQRCGQARPDVAVQRAVIHGHFGREVALEGIVRIGDGTLIHLIHLIIELRNPRACAALSAQVGRVA